MIQIDEVKPFIYLALLICCLLNFNTNLSKIDDVIGYNDAKYISDNTQAELNFDNFNYKTRQENDKKSESKLNNGDVTSQQIYISIRILIVCIIELIISLYLLLLLKNYVPKLKILGEEKKNE